MKIRLMGTAEDLAAAVSLLEQVFDVQEASDFYQNRGASKLGRVYIEVASPASTTTVQAHAVRADRAELAGQLELESGR